MAKKFGKLLLISAAIGSAVGAVYYFSRKKNAEHDSAEEDYDDFSEEEKKEEDSDSRSYVPLTPEGAAEDGADCSSSTDDAAPAQEPEAPSEEAASTQGTCDAPASQDGFTPLSEQVADTAQKAEETVEEFFDEDSTDEEPPITDN